MFTCAGLQLLPQAVTPGCVFGSLLSSRPALAAATAELCTCICPMHSVAQPIFEAQNRSVAGV